MKQDYEIQKYCLKHKKRSLEYFIDLKKKKNYNILEEGMLEPKKEWNWLSVAVKVEIQDTTKVEWKSEKKEHKIITNMIL